MLFKRRKPLALHIRTREALWPSMGWGRAASYFRHRLLRQSASTYKIAGGLATGVAVSFTPLLGTHFIQSALYAHFMRQSKIAALVGTFWGNPWTIPPMFYLDYKIGAGLFSLFGFTALLPPDDHGLAHLWQEPLYLFLPMLLGGIICAVVSWPLAYLGFYFPVRGMQRAYRLERLRRRRRHHKKDKA
ncbi:MAG: DUF2062 domain-containing protein [Micavibrio sp.]